MHVEYEIRGRVEMPEGTRLVPGMSNLFELPSGAVISVQPVIEMASSTVADDHRDLTYAEAATLGVVLDLFDRDSTLL